MFSGSKTNGILNPPQAHAGLGAARLEDRLAGDRRLAFASSTRGRSGQSRSCSSSRSSPRSRRFLLARDLWTGADHVAFTLQIVIWLWFTVLFANFAEAVAEGRGKAQADALRETRTRTKAKRLLMPDNRELYELVWAEELQPGELVLVETGDIIPGDGEVIEGMASVNEAAITGESAPVIRELGGDRSAVTGGTTVISDKLIVRITASKGSSFLDRMISLIEGAQRQKTPNEIALNILLAGMTIIFVFAVATIPSYVAYASGAVSIVVLVALFVTLIPTTIGALLSAIGIAGMDRLVRFNVLAMSGRAVEAAGDVDTLLLDKTGTITLGNRQATAFQPIHGVHETGARRCGATGVACRRDAGGTLDRRPGKGEIRHSRPRAFRSCAASRSRSPRTAA